MIDDEAWSEPVTGSRLWAAVADGMGGHEAGNIASEVAIEAVASPLGAARSEQDMVELALAANRQIFQAMFSGEGRMRMGTTLVAAIVRRDTALFVNVGDSRAYQLSGDKLRLVTKDDTLPSQASGRRQHILTQSLGGLAFQSAITPHVTRVQFGLRDRLLLCSDGLTDLVSDNDLAQILRREREEPAHALVAAALASGGRDNITVIVIGEAVEGEGERSG
ncbi:MAG: PP2C family protein-serine/threonine phosphatase [Novosphingobium sp.]